MDTGVDLDDDFDRKWAEFAHHLEPALDGSFTLADVEELIRADPNVVFWPLKRSAVVTEILHYPALRSCRVWLAGGDLDELLHFLPALDNYARSEGCTRIELDGRKGWHRVLEGYEFQRVTLTKDLI